MGEDIKMSDFNEAKLVKILGLDSDGNSKKEGLATMIARCLSPYVMLKYNGVIEKESNLNDLQNGAYYYFVETGEISNSPGFDRFALLQIDVGTFGLQIAFAVVDRGVKWRTKHGGDDWQSWNAISFT